MRLRKEKRHWRDHLHRHYRSKNWCPNPKPNALSMLQYSLIREEWKILSYFEYFRIYFQIDFLPQRLRRVFPTNLACFLLLKERKSLYLWKSWCDEKRRGFGGEQTLESVSERESGGSDSQLESESINGETTGILQNHGNTPIAHGLSRRNKLKEDSNSFFCSRSILFSFEKKNIFGNGIGDKTNNNMPSKSFLLSRIGLKASLSCVHNARFIENACILMRYSEWRNERRGNTERSTNHHGNYGSNRDHGMKISSYSSVETNLPRPPPKYEPVLQFFRKINSNRPSMTSMQQLQSDLKLSFPEMKKLVIEARQWEKDAYVRQAKEERRKASGRAGD